jgi:hypothetical protein
MELKEEQEEEIWKQFLREHWKMVIVAAGIIVAAAIAAVYVFLGVMDATIASTPILATLGKWTVGYIVTFLLNLILWEFLIIGIPLIAAALGAYFLWWKQVPAEERSLYKSEEKKSSKNSNKGGGLVSFGITVVWLIIVYMNNMWNVAFESWTVSYLITSSLWACGLVLLIAGIPILIGGVWWLRRELKKPA